MSIDSGGTWAGRQRRPAESLERCHALALDPTGVTTALRRAFWRTACGNRHLQRASLTSFFGFGPDRPRRRGVGPLHQRAAAHEPGRPVRRTVNRSRTPRRSARARATSPRPFLPASRSSTPTRFRTSEPRALPFPPRATREARSSRPPPLPDVHATVRTGCRYRRSSAGRPRRPGLHRTPIRPSSSGHEALRLRPRGRTTPTAPTWPSTTWVPSLSRSRSPSSPETTGASSR